MTKGDYVLAFRIHWFGGQPDTIFPKPFWARVNLVDNDGDASVDFDPNGWNEEMSKLVRGDEIGWTLRPQDIIPENKVTDQQWAALAAWRLSQ